MIAIDPAEKSGSKSIQMLTGCCITCGERFVIELAPDAPQEAIADPHTRINLMMTRHCTNE